MNADTKKKIEDACPKDLHFRPECDSMGWKCGAHESWREGAEVGYNLALKDAEVLVKALEESKTHFNSIMSGLTSDIDMLEEVMKCLAWQAGIEVSNALDQWKKVTE